MSDEVLKRDGNYVTVLGAITDDANQYVKMLRVDPSTGRLLVSVTGAGAGDVTGPGSSTDNAIVRFNGTNGASIQNSGIIIDDSNNVTGIAVLGATGSRLTKGWFTDLEVTNTIVGDITGNATTATSAGTANALTTPRTIGGVSFDGTANITVATATGGFTVSGGDLALGANNLTLMGSIASTGSRVTKGWFTDVESSNMPTVGGTSLSSTFSPIAGSANITTVGTISSGTWEATDVGVAHGGTGKSSWTQYLIPYADTTTSFSQIAIGTLGQVLTSNGAGSAPTFQDPSGGGGYTVVTKTSDESVTSSTTFQDDDELAFAVSANTNYWVRINLIVKQGDGGFKFGYSGPSSPSSVYVFTTHNNNTTSTPAVHSETAFSSIVDSYASDGGGSTKMVLISTLMHIRNGSNAGTVTIRWAQSASNADSSIVYAGSNIEYLSE